MSKPLFICSIEPKDGVYHWLLEKDGETFGGSAPTQQEAIKAAMSIRDTEEVMLERAELEAKYKEHGNETCE